MRNKGSNRNRPGEGGVVLQFAPSLYLTTSVTLLKSTKQQYNFFLALRALAMSACMINILSVMHTQTQAPEHAKRLHLFAPVYTLGRLKVHIQLATGAIKGKGLMGAR